MQLSDPIKRYIYFADSGQKPSIQRAHLDGSNKKAIVTENIKEPTDLTVNMDNHMVASNRRRRAATSIASYANFADLLDGRRRRRHLSSAIGRRRAGACARRYCRGDGRCAAQRPNVLDRSAPRKSFRRYERAESNAIRLIADYARLTSRRPRRYCRI